VADGGGHSADLAVAAFVDAEFDPEILDGFSQADGGIAWRDERVGFADVGVGGEGGFAVEGDATAEAGEGFFIWEALDEDEVGFWNVVVGIEEADGPGGFVGEEEEAFRVGVEAADGVGVFWKSEVGEGAVGTAVGRELGEDAVGFVEGEDQRILSRVRSWESTTPMGRRFSSKTTRSSMRWCWRI
jgi:hypothetical protein